MLTQVSFLSPLKRVYFMDKADKCLSIASFYPRHKIGCFQGKAIMPSALFFGSVSFGQANEMNAQRQR
jgi:hypothetical protein